MTAQDGMLTASLPMYDWPELQPANDMLWSGMARHLGVGFGLDRLSDYRSVWHHPALLFSQTCGYPFVHEFRGKLELIATPHYTADGCEGPDYRSIIFAREKAPLASFRGSRAAVNGPDSMSGMLALKLVFAPLATGGQFFREAVETGGHLRSLEAVRDGRADVCAVDSVCTAHARRHRPEVMSGLVEIARSPKVPALPFVTRAGDVEKLRDALWLVFADDDYAEARDTLLLAGYSVLPRQAYDRITELEAAMQRGGGLELL